MATRNDGIFDDYTTIQWVAAGLVAILTFPVGLLVPIYFYIKTNNGTAREQGAWEAWAVILLPIIGIIAVELAGETGAKIALAVMLLLQILGLLVAVVVGVFTVGVFTVGISEAAQIHLALSAASVAVPL